MTEAGRARVNACFENLEDVFPVDDPRSFQRSKKELRQVKLSQLPQLPQRYSKTSIPLHFEEDCFEERAAIMEYEGRMPRSLAEFLARKK